MPTNESSAPMDYVVSRVKAAVKDPAGSHRNLEVQTRTISPTQISFVVQTFLHNESVIVLDLPKLDGAPLRVKGTIKVCQHNNGLLHICLVELENKLDLSMFIKPPSTPLSKKPVSDNAPESANGAQLQPLSVLYIDDQDADRKLVTYQTKDTHIELVSADSTGSACDLLKLDTFDVVVCDFHLEDTTGIDLLNKIKPELYSGPVIFATAETRETELVKMKTAGADEVITKPLDITRLSAAIAAVLDENRDQQTKSFDPFDAPPSDMDFAKSYIPMLTRLRDDMARAKAKRDVALAKTVCRSVMGTAGGYGFQRLSRTAERAYAAIDAANNIDLAGKPVAEFRSQMDTIIQAASPETEAEATAA
ncbi:MAG: response regulator [Phycisphaerales bacterium JB061]